MSEGDWIVADPDGIHYDAMKPEVFEKTYVQVEEDEMEKQSDRLCVDEIKREVAEHIQHILTGGFVIKVDGVYIPVVALQFSNKKLDTDLTIQTDQGLRHFNVHVRERFLNEGRIEREGRIL